MSGGQSADRLRWQDQFYRSSVTGMNKAGLILRATRFQNAAGIPLEQRHSVDLSLIFGN